MHIITLYILDTKEMFICIMLTETGDKHRLYVPSWHGEGFNI